MKTEKVEKIVANLDDKTKYVIRIRNLNSSFKPQDSVKKVA